MVDLDTEIKKVESASTLNREDQLNSNNLALSNMVTANPLNKRSAMDVTEDDDDSVSDISKGDVQSHCSEGLYMHINNNKNDHSDSDTDGYHSEGSYFGGGANRNLLGDGTANIDGISEHASDEASSDSEGEVKKKPSEKTADKQKKKKKKD